MRSSLVACALGAVAAFGGCGTGGSERDIAGVVERFGSDLEVGDGQGACAQLTVPARDALAEDEGKPCRAAILTLGLDDGGRVKRVAVYLTSGFAETSQQTLFLDQTKNGWRINAAGCAPKGPGKPYDCALES